MDPQSPGYDPKPLVQYLAALGVPYFFEEQGKCLKNPVNATGHPQSVLFEFGCLGAGFGKSASITNAGISSTQYPPFLSRLFYKREEKNGYVEEKKSKP